MGYAAAGGGPWGRFALGIGTAGVVLLAAAIALRFAGLIPWSLLLVAGGYLAAHAGKGVVDGWAAVVGVLLLLTAELAYWSVDHDSRIRTERTLVVRRTVTLAALLAVSLFVNVVLLATAAVSTSAGVLLAAVGVAAAVTAVAAVLRLLRAST